MINFNRPMFGTNTQSESLNKISHATDDFDITAAMLESFIVLEQVFTDINRNQMTSMHYGVIEENYDILEEGFRDFFSSAVEFFKSMVKKFTEFMKRIFMMINAYIGNFDKFLENYKDRIEKLNPDFTIQGFKFEFDSRVPHIDRIRSIINDFNSELSDVDKITKEGIMKEREEFTSDIFVNKIRAEVIGASGSITKDNYLRTIKQKFRSGSDETENIKVDSTVLKNTVSGYPDLKKTYKECSQQRDRVILLIESMKTFFERGVNINYSGDNKVLQAHNVSINDDGSRIDKGDAVDTKNSTSNHEKLNLFYSFKLLQAKELGGIAVTAAIEKVNALKEALKQSEQIIRRSLHSSTKAESGETK
jgi:hypothetical protein